LAKSVQEKTVAMEQAAIYKSIETDRKSIEWWFAALSIMTTIVAALGALMPYLLGRKDKELLQVELAGIKNDRADIQRIKNDVQVILNESKVDGAAIKGHKEEAERDRALMNAQQPDNKSSSAVKEQVIEAADRLIKTSNDPKEASRAEAIKASKLNDGELALLLWQRFLAKYPDDAQASFYVAYWLQHTAEKESDSAADDLEKVCKAYEIAEKNDMLNNGSLKNQWIPNNWGNVLNAQASALFSKDPEAADKLWLQASIKYAQALDIKPDAHQTASNWGNVLSVQADALKSKDPKAAQVLWSQASTKYAQALAFKPDDHKAAYNWGTALSAQARALASEDPKAAQTLWSQASIKYDQALTMKPDDHEAINSWGSALSAQASALNSIDTESAQRLWSLASTKYKQALAFKPDDHIAAYNWGITLAAQASALTAENPEIAQMLWSQASTKYAQVLAIKPDDHEVINNWGAALSAQASAINSLDPESAQKLWSQASTKYALALTIKPDNHEAANNWGVTLDDQARALNCKDSDAAQGLWDQASTKYVQALTIKQDMHEAANNWGIALNTQALALNRKDPEAALVLWAQAVELLERHASLVPVMMAYELACIYSLINKLELALTQLEIRRVGMALPEHWRTDGDLANLRTTDAYQQWFAKHFPKG
jgi:hypothetical protein